MRAILAEEMTFISGGAVKNPDNCVGRVEAGGGLGSLIGGILGTFAGPAGTILGAGAGALIGGGTAASTSPGCERVLAWPDTNANGDYNG